MARILLNLLVILVLALAASASHAGSTEGCGRGDSTPVKESCADGIQNQDETDVDCGGAICGQCPDGGGCLVGTDCQSGLCSTDVCQPS